MHRGLAMICAMSVAAGAGSQGVDVFVGAGLPANEPMISLRSFAPKGAPTAAPMIDYTIVGDAVPAPLTAEPGDATRGRTIALDRRTGNCLICHRLPVDEPFQGDLAPDMSSVGARLDAGQIRLRLIDASRLNPATIMPPYYRVDGLRDVATEYAGRPALDAQQIEDVVAYLVTLTGTS